MRKTKQFNSVPEVKTSCVRIKYSEGYHVDFAVYRRELDENNNWIYQHSGSEWTTRDLSGLTEWFNNKNDSSAGKLRKVVRLSKMFCKSCSSWKNMPSGLLQTVLCEECLADSYDRIDEIFYYSMRAIVDRLEHNLSVYAPVDNARDLTPRKSDIKKMINWKNRLRSKLEDLDILFDEECTQNDALQAWYGFFNHEYWSEQESEAADRSNANEFHKSEVISFSDNEEFIEDLYPVDLKYCCSIDCKIIRNGWRPQSIKQFLSSSRKYIPHQLTISCDMAATNCPSPYRVLWKVKNVGPESERRNQIRGQIRYRGNHITEPTSFFGNHYIECYVIKNNQCVARDRVGIPISRR